MEVRKSIRTTSRKRDDVINMIGKQNAMTIRIQAAINADILLCIAKPLDVFSVKATISALFPRTTAFYGGSAFVGIPSAPITRLTINCFAVLLSVLAFVIAVANFTKACYTVVLTGAIEKFIKRFDLSTSPASFLSSFFEPLFGFTVFCSIRIPDFLSALFTTGRIPIRMPSVFVELRQRLEDMAASAAFHLASVRKSVFRDWGQVGTENLLFGPSAYPKSHSTITPMVCQVGRCNL